MTRDDLEVSKIWNRKMTQHSRERVERKQNRDKRGKKKGDGLKVRNRGTTEKQYAGLDDMDEYFSDV